MHFTFPPRVIKAPHTALSGQVLLPMKGGEKSGVKSEFSVGWRQVGKYIVMALECGKSILLSSREEIPVVTHSGPTFKLPVGHWEPCLPTTWHIWKEGTSLKNASISWVHGLICGAFSWLLMQNVGGPSPPQTAPSLGKVVVGIWEGQLNGGLGTSQ